MNVITGTTALEQSPQELRTKKRGSNRGFAGYRLLCPDYYTQMEMANVVEDGEVCWKCGAEIEIWLTVDTYREKRGWPDRDINWVWPPSEHSECDAD